MSSGSDTELSEWNKSPGSRPTNNLYQRDSNRVSFESTSSKGSPSAHGTSSSESISVRGDILYPTPASAPNTSTTPNSAPIGPTEIEKSQVSSGLQSEQNIVEAQVPQVAHAGLGSAQEQATPENPWGQYVPSMPSSATPSRGGKTGGRRGRGGRSQLKSTIDPVTGEAIPASASRGRTVNRGGRPRGSRAGGSTNRGGRPRGSKAGVSSATSRRVSSGKRKRKHGDSDESDDGGNTSGSEAINLPMLSSSGRRITQASSYTPAVSFADLEDEATPGSTAKKARVTFHGIAGAVGLPSAIASSERRKKQKKVPSASAVCKNCGRGHSPQSNQIVFCDGCNTPWHQYCHDRPITPTVILHEEKEWHCADCAVMANIEKAGEGRVSATVLAQSSGVERSLKWQRDYLLGQSREVLVNMLLNLKEKWDEDLALFEYNASFMPNAVAVLEGKADEMSSAAGRVTIPDDDEIHEEPLPYPKMGNGLVLSKGTLEDDWDLMVDESVSTFSHSWQQDGIWHGQLANELPVLGIGTLGAGITIGVGA
ncbi:uncharacterized protein KY384_000527 [Bacidia gigantensis]|uniref:uncharacterized protein n=1 Tax=Bacidia gigantensis TaxID=2732470 RepID=UPI001D049826|nr:uncharacterized protein KY384_000527 [Bacidia gigantensis]KAG8525767.1 hypothetical protein KY384_000527 [Bacidia gigantensis]